MRREIFFRYLNWFLVFCLLLSLGALLAVYIDSRNEGGKMNGTEKESKDEVKKEIDDEDLIYKDDNFEKEEVMEEKTVDQVKVDQTKDDIDTDTSDKDNSDEEIEKEDDKDLKDDSDKDNEDGTEETGEFTGILMKAEDDNPFGGNYKLMNDGDTDYTYFWFDSGYATNGVDNMVGKKVLIEVRYLEDGGFEIIDGPKIVG